IVQCPSTTTVIAAARRKSTTRLRVSGVAASTLCARLMRVLVIGAVPSSVPRPRRHGPLAVTALYRRGAPGTARRRPRAVLASTLPRRHRVCQALTMSSHHDHGAHEHADPHTHLSPTDYWEQRYADSERIWSGKVNATLAAVARDLTPGDSIDLRCWEGVDVLWLAAQRWRPHGLDISATAAGRAREEAAARGLENASFTATDLSAWRPDPDSADLVTASFFQSNVELDRIAILRTAASALRSGGHLLGIPHASPPPWAGTH